MRKNYWILVKPLHFALLFLMTFGATIASAQRNVNILDWRYSKHVSLYKIRDKEVGFSLDGMIYQGDLCPDVTGNIKDIGPGVSYIYNFFYNERFSLKSKARVGMLRGDDKGYWDKDSLRGYRGFKFQTLIAEVSTAVQWEMLGGKLPYSFWWEYGVPKHFITPYISIGVGLMYFNPSIDYSSYDATKFSGALKQRIESGLDIDHRMDYSKFTLKVPVTFGVKYYHTRHWCWFIEGEANPAFTDYLDGYAKSVNPANDSYTTFSIGVLHTFIGNTL